MKKSFFNLVFISGLALVLSACNTMKAGNTISNYKSNRTSLDILVQNSQQALNAQQMLTKYREQQSAILTIKQANFDTDEMVLNYIGKPQPLLNSISIKYGYRFLEFGTPIHLPTVNFTNVYTTPHDALVMLNAQLGQTASIGLDKNQKIISITYKDHN